MAANHARPRHLDFATLEEATAEAERLLVASYTPTGKWNRRESRRVEGNLMQGESDPVRWWSKRRVLIAIVVIANCLPWVLFRMIGSPWEWPRDYGTDIGLGNRYLAWRALASALAVIIVTCWEYFGLGFGYQLDLSLANWKFVITESLPMALWVCGTLYAFRIAGYRLQWHAPRFLRGITGDSAKP